MTWEYFEGLGGEKIRWTEQSHQFKAEIKELVGNVLLATGFLSYCGPFNQEFRNYMLKETWEKELISRKIPFASDLNLIALLIDAPTIGELPALMNLYHELVLLNVYGRRVEPAGTTWG